MQPTTKGKATTSATSLRLLHLKDLYLCYTLYSKRTKQRKDGNRQRSLLYKIKKQTADENNSYQPCNVRYT